MHINSINCRTICTEVEQANEVNNLAFSKASSNKCVDNVLDIVEFNDNMCDHKMCRNFYNLKDGNDTKDSDDSVSNHHEK
jgi:hypothetical protein